MSRPNVHKNAVYKLWPHVIFMFQRLQQAITCTSQPNRCLLCSNNVCLLTRLIFSRMHLYDFLRKDCLRDQSNILFGQVEISYLLCQTSYSQGNTWTTCAEYTPNTNLAGDPRWSDLVTLSLNRRNLTLS